MVALNPASFARLRKSLKNNQIARRYLAMVRGALDRPLQLDGPIAHHPRNRRKMTVVHEARAALKLRARAASTAVNPIRRLGGFTLVEVTPRTGSRHQIRVHLASAGYPIAGDTLYGGPRLATLAPGRVWLHLREVEFESPASGRVKVEAPRPADLSSIPIRN